MQVRATDAITAEAGAIARHDALLSAELGDTQSLLPAVTHAEREQRRLRTGALEEAREQVSAATKYREVAESALETETAEVAS